MAAPAHTSGLVYDDLANFPDDHLRRELIGGELVVTPAPRVRHQEVVGEVFAVLRAVARSHGGKALVAPLDVVLSEADVVEPDVLYVGPDNLDRLEERFLRGAPDIAIEVSSPSTRRLELIRKRDLYERHCVPEYWYVDLDADRIEVYRLDERGRFPTPTLFSRGQTLSSSQLPGLELTVEDVLGEAE